MKNRAERLRGFARGFLAGSIIEIAYSLWKLNNTPFLGAYLSGEAYIFIFFIPAVAAALILFEEVIFNAKT